MYGEIVEQAIDLILEGSPIDEVAVALKRGERWTPTYKYATVPFDSGKMIRRGKGRLHLHPGETDPHYDKYDPTRGIGSAAKHFAVDYVWQHKLKSGGLHRQQRKLKGRIKDYEKQLARRHLTPLDRDRLDDKLAIARSQLKYAQKEFERTWTPPV